MKSYNQFCGLALALDHVGERWSLLLVRELIPGSRRYSELMEALPGITTNLLARRLKMLTSQNLIQKSGKAYALTETGRKLIPAILALAEFGQHFLPPPDRSGMARSLRNLSMNLLWRYTDGWRGHLGLKVQDTMLHVADHGTGLTISDFCKDTPQTIVTGSPPGFLAWILHGADLNQLLDQGQLSFTGDLNTFVALDACLKPVNHDHG